ncbi:Formate hydrogenlyase transcriptional activator [Salinivirga cyanobacteriivorans]|uniref:Formate hydrogenlyase transcriptional activator n=1 Tax=Salinivirga cyanobacteriivorans TaxID=1307839 RepID=A0A0S2I3F3_9BACT|nr:sigma-54 dependent transcriptional regulator [Salinivirga cyanobacteriivorans]ALO16947.1 Formate hydrogenlyase transcriptional activator [Salinivirga cyanobacteriivorans]
MKHKILYVDDEQNNLLTFDLALNNWYDVEITTSPQEALTIIDREDIDVLLTDQRMPEMTGLELAQIVKQKHPWLSIIIVTAFDDSNTVMQAVNQGGIYRYILKPWNLNDIKQSINNAIENSTLKKNNENLIKDLKAKNKKLVNSYNFILSLKKQVEEENTQLKQLITNEETNNKYIVTQNRDFQKTISQALQVAKTDSTVLLLGETGTGKELMAQIIHEESSRARQLMIKVNCAAIPENLVESELFGHEKGAFTGADQLKYGKFELAHKGTLFLDEIGELPPAIQTKLLRVLQENEFERVGGTKTTKTNFRLIAATNRNLEKAVQQGEFRSDLYYRINIIPIKLPPLRDHLEDIPLLVGHFIEKLNKTSHKTIDTIPQKALKKLQAYQWPGNIRELQNIIERAHVLSPANKLQIDDWFQLPQPQTAENEPTALHEQEKKHILKVLKSTNWKIRGENGAARLLDIKPTTLESRMKKLNITRPD